MSVKWPCNVHGIGSTSQIAHWMISVAERNEDLSLGRRMTLTGCGANIEDEMS